MMNHFFEVIKKKTALSRIGRLNFSKSSKNYMRTPSIFIPINELFVKDINFIMEFEENEIFLIDNEEFLKKTFLHEKFRNKGFIYTYGGVFENFVNILENNIDLFTNENIISIIPFNIPTTTISKAFAQDQIECHISELDHILKNFQDISFGISIKLFDYNELFPYYFQLIQDNSNIKIINFSDLFENLSNFRRIIDVIITFKKNYDRNILLMASGKILPSYYPILVYLGFDLIDSSYSLYISSENFYDSLEKLLPIYKIKYLPCSCIACRKDLKNHLDEKYSSVKTRSLCIHNLCVARNFMNKIKQYLQFEDYRAFVEKASLNNLYFISILKILDKMYYSFLENETPIYQKKVIINSFGPSSYYRPDFEEFRKRVINNFEPESQTSLIILLPCSSKKPYSLSRSHQKFFEAIRKFPDFPNFQEIILTSPLGAIPRQLEDMYPVNSYDISVTGDWDKEEIKISSDMLNALLRKYDSDIPVICHLSGDYIKIIERSKKTIGQKIYITNVEKKITSKSSIESLHQMINNHHLDFKTSPRERVPKENLKTLTRKLIKMIDYQLGVGVGEQLVNDSVVIKKNRRANTLELTHKKNTKKLLEIKNDSGVLNLTIYGANKVYSLEKFTNLIVFDGDIITGNTLFRPGIREFAPSIIPNEQIILLNKNKTEVIAVGKALVSSTFIKNSKTGRIVKIYDKKR